MKTLSQLPCCSAEKPNPKAVLNALAYNGSNDFLPTNFRCSCFYSHASFVGGKH